MADEIRFSEENAERLLNNKINNLAKNENFEFKNPFINKFWEKKTLSLSKKDKSLKNSQTLDVQLKLNKNDKIFYYL